MDKWFSVQAGANRDDALDRASRLRAHADFDLRNPNRVRALGGALAMRNPRAFHAASGAGYRLLADLIAEVDPRNPALAARLATGFETWRLVEPGRRALAQAAIEALRARDVSANLSEILAKIAG
jgi:aminopeptidase N